MPVGASKLGVLGAGLVPGGSVTFNTSGNWPVPPGVKKVSITGRGGSGNPGNAGNPGNPGNLGIGGGGGAGGGGLGHSPQSGGGVAWSGTAGCFNSNSTAGGTIPNPTSPSSAGNAGSTGSSGNAGQAGQAGQAGNPGQSSSGLGNTFPGGAGGNAGAAGNAGNGGSGGQGGGGGGVAPVGAGGAGGNGGGSGSSKSSANIPQRTINPQAPGVTRTEYAGAGGGGAGASNDGAPGTNTLARNLNMPFCFFIVGQGGRGGTTANYAGPLLGPLPQVSINPQNFFTDVFPNPGQIGPSNQTGGLGSTVTYGPSPGNISGTISRGGASITASPQQCPGRESYRRVGNNPATQQPRTGISNFNLAQPESQALRSGGGGGSGGACNSGGGGGGGRGNAGNAGGAGGAGGTGAAGTPQTFNCVTVTPGSTTPITVSSPGGQVVISWNPQ
jgi:hypothetical protein